MKKNLGAVDLLDEARDFETQKLQNIYGAGMKMADKRAGIGRNCPPLNLFTRLVRRSR